MTVPTPPTVTDPARDANAHNATAAVATSNVATSNGYTGIDHGAPPKALDTDADGLTVDFEKLAGTNAASADSDSDGLSDSFKALHSHTDPIAEDTDSDGISDAAEIAARTDAGAIPGIAGVSGLGDHAQNIRAGVVDTDLDGLTDPYEGAPLGSPMGAPVGTPVVPETDPGVDDNHLLTVDSGTEIQ